MSLLTRLADLISANLNALLDRAEDPEKMLAHVIEQMETGQAKARHQGARAIAAERRLERELEQNRAAAASWRDQASRALAGGREDLARRALARRIEHDDLVTSWEVSWQRPTRLAWRSRRRCAPWRQDWPRRAASSESSSRSTMPCKSAVTSSAQARAGPSTSRALSPRFERLENRLTDLNDDLQAHIEVAHSNGDLEAELAALENRKRIDEELQALKKELVT